MVSQEDILQMVKENGGTMRLTEIRNRHYLSGSDISRQVRRLGKCGYVKVHRKPAFIIELLVDEWEPRMVI